LVIATSTGGLYFTMDTPSGGWTAPQPLSPPFEDEGMVYSDVAAVGTPAATMAVYAVVAGEVLVKPRSAPGPGASFGVWQRLGARSARGVSSVAMSAGEQRVLMVDDDGRLWRTTRDPSTESGVSQWREIRAPEALTAAEAGAYATNPAATFSLFALGASGAVYECEGPSFPDCDKWLVLKRADEAPHLRSLATAVFEHHHILFGVAEGGNLFHTTVPDGAWRPF
jgi:hypothetical protein